LPRELKELLEKMNIVQIAIDNLKKQGFDNVKAIDPDTSDFPIPKPISVKDLNGNSNFTIVSVDARATKEFYDFIYVALEDNTNRLLEAASISKTPKIYNEQEALLKLKEKFPETSFEIMSGYFWKSEFRSFLTIVPCFKTGNKDMFLLPDGNTTNNLDEYTMEA
jgi:hypothetical protein